MLRLPTHLSLSYNLKQNKTIILQMDKFDNFLLLFPLCKQYVLVQM